MLGDSELRNGGKLTDVWKEPIYIYINKLRRGEKNQYHTIYPEGVSGPTYTISKVFLFLPP